MVRLFLAVALLASIGSQCNAQSLIPFQFTSEEDNQLVKETDSVKIYTATGDSNLVSIDEENLYYKLMSRGHKLLAEGAYITEGEKFLQDGKWLARYENGKLKTTGSYRKGIPIGTWQEYYENGKPKRVTNYTPIASEHGELFSCMSGTYIEYFENGKVKTSGFYSAAFTKVTDTMYVDDPILNKSVTKYNVRYEYFPEKTGHWEHYTESGELDKKEDF